MKIRSLFTLFLLFGFYPLFALELSSTNSYSSLIIYNSSLGVVEEHRDLKLTPDDTSITYKDVASTINTDSIYLDLPSEITLYSQHYKFDKLTKNKLLEAHLGKNVIYKEQEVELLAYDTIEALIKTPLGEIMSVASKDILFNNIPKTLHTQPSLVWDIKTTKKIDANLKINYLINNISWQSNYILDLKEKSADLRGWISIDNRSGKHFTNTKLHLLAGDIARISQAKSSHLVYARAINHIAETDVAHKAIEGYHFYTIPFDVTLANNEKTQIKFIEQNNIPVQRNYKTTLSYPSYLTKERRSGVQQYLSIEKLPIALPRGAVRSYTNFNNTKILLGESSLTHTPKNEKITLLLGDNFDLIVKEKVIEKEESKRFITTTINYELTNHSDSDKELTLLIPFSNKKDAVVKSSKEFIQTQGDVVTFTIHLKKDQKLSFDTSFYDPR